MQNIRKNNDNGEIVIELLPLIKALLRHIGLIVLVTIIAAIASYLITHFFVKPTYRTNFSVYVNNHTEMDKSTVLTSSDLSASKSLAKTYAEIIKSRHVLMEASGNCGLSYSYQKLAGMVTTSTNNDTEIITVYIESESASEAYKLAQKIADTAKARVTTIVEGSSMQVVDEPFMPDTIYQPNYMKSTIIGGILGFIIITVILTLIIIMDNRIKSDEELENRYDGLVVLGIIPDSESANKASEYGYGYGRKKGR